MDLSGMDKLKKQLKSTEVDVGYLHPVEHWNSSPTNPITVPALAAHYHYNSPWADSFMLDYTRNLQVNGIVQANLKSSFGNTTVHHVAHNIGRDLRKTIQTNIENTVSPSNAPSWVERKGFNDPLIYGSDTGEAPNLISELSWEVKHT